MLGKEKKIKIPHNPVTNGSTKKMIFISLVMLGAISLVSTILMFSLNINVLDKSQSFTVLMASLGVKLGLGGISTSAIGGIIYAIKSFFDTRSTEQKDEYRIKKFKVKNERLKIKYNYKLKKKGTVSKNL